MKPKSLSVAEKRAIDALVQHFVDNNGIFSQLLYQLSGYISSSNKLSSLIHSTKQRVKDADTLRAKLVRKMLIAKNARKFFQ